MTATLITEFDWQDYPFPGARVLDLACGDGRNGLWFAHRGCQVSFIDRDLSRLAAQAATLANASLLKWDMEQPHSPTLPENQFDIVLVFNYLHRPLLPQIMSALKPGGLLFYETFTRQQALVGRPRNPDFLFEAGELSDTFSAWHAIHNFEGAIENSLTAGLNYKAQLICRKPNNQQ